MSIRISMIIALLLTNICLGGDIMSRLQGEWWGGIPPKLSRVLRVESNRLDMFQCAHSYSTNAPQITFGLVQGADYNRLVFPAKKDQPEGYVLFFFLNDNLLKAEWPSSENLKPTSFSKESMLFYRAPAISVSNDFVGIWSNRKSGFSGVWISLEADGKCVVSSVSAGLPLQWRLAGGNKAVAEDLTHGSEGKQPVRFVFHTTPTNILLVVESDSGASVYERTKENGMSAGRSR